MKLRTFLYLNTKTLDDYIAAIDGYVYETETLSEKTSSQKGGEAKASASIISASGKLGQDRSQEIIREVKVTPVAKFEKLYSYLSQDGGLKYYEGLSDTTYQGLFRDNFIEVLVTPRFSKLKSFISTVQGITSLASAFEGMTDQVLMDDTTTNMFDSITKLGESKNKSELPCVFSFSDSQYPLVAYMDKQCFQVEADRFVGQCYMLCKIQRKVEKGESIKLDEIFDVIKDIPMNREQRHKLQTKNMSNPAEFKDIVKGPAFVVAPVAVYQ